MFILVRAVRDLEPCKSKHYKPRWITIAWSFVGAFSSLERAFEAQKQYISGMTPEMQKTEADAFRIKEVPIDQCSAI